MDAGADGTTAGTKSVKHAIREAGATQLEMWHAPLLLSNATRIASPVNPKRRGNHVAATRTEAKERNR
jgi:hypothetical protein